MSEKLTINSQVTLEMAIELLREEYALNKYLIVSYETGKQRTPQQNKALHVYCRLVSEAFNTAGLDMRKVLKEDIEIPWNMELVKEFIWRPVQLAVIGEESTAEAHRGDYNAVFEVLSRHLADKFGISVGWPQKDRE